MVTLMALDPFIAGGDKSSRMGMLRTLTPTAAHDEFEVEERASGRDGHGQLSLY
jgi:hypothetical protein